MKTRKAQATTKDKAVEWGTVKMQSLVIERARTLRKRLLKGGQTCLPPALRKAILIPDGRSPKLGDRKFGLGQIFELGLTALDCLVKDGK